MAIKTTYFVNTTVAADNAAEVYAWLQENATEYFDSFAISEDGLTVSCFIGELEAVTFAFNSSEMFQFIVTLPNGTTSKHSATNSDKFITKAVKTSNGIVFQLEDYIPFMIITKSANGETATVHNNTYNISTTNKIYAAIPTKDSAFASFSVYYDIAVNDYTSITNVVCPSGAGYLPNLYRMVFSQYRGTEGIISLNGKKYYTNGYLALAE